MEAAHPEAVYRALLPEAKEGKRFCVEIKGPEPLIISIEAQDPTALRAALNSYLRLLSLLHDIEEQL